MISPELQTKIQIWKQKSAADTLTIDEMREAVAYMRQGRRAAAEASATSKRSGGTRTKAPAQSADDMLKALEGL